LAGKLIPLFAFILILYSTIAHSTDIYKNENMEFSLSGSYKNLYTISETILKEDFWSDLNRLRLEFDVELKDSVLIKAILDNEVLLGTILGTGEFLFSKKIEEDTFFDLDNNLIDNPDLFWSQNLYRIYLSYSTEKMNLTAGRQRVTWGTGRIWNPIDLFNSVSPLKIESGERAGVDAVNVEYFLGSLSYISFVYAPGKESFKTSVASRVKTNLKGFDLSLVLGEFRRNMVLGFDFAGSMGDSGFSGEVTFTDPEVGKEFTRFLLSWDHTFTSSLFILFEYLHNGGNLDGENLRRFIDTESRTIFTGEIVTRNKHFLGSVVGYDITLLLRGDILIIYDIDDNSIFTRPSLTYNVMSNVDWTVGGQIFSGSMNSEFGDLNESFFTSVKCYF